MLRVRPSVDLEKLVSKGFVDSQRTYQEVQNSVEEILAILVTESGELDVRVDGEGQSRQAETDLEVKELAGRDAKNVYAKAGIDVNVGADVEEGTTLLMLAQREGVRYRGDLCGWGGVFSVEFWGGSRDRGNGQEVRDHKSENERESLHGGPIQGTTGARDREGGKKGRVKNKRWT